MSSPDSLSPSTFSKGWPTPPLGCAHGDYTPEVESSVEELAEEEVPDARPDDSSEEDSEESDEDTGDDSGRPRRYRLRQWAEPVDWAAFFKSPEGTDIPFLKELNRDPNRPYLVKFPDELLSALGQGYLNQRNERALRSAYVMEETGYMTGHHALRAYVVLVQDTRKTPECYTLNTTVGKELATERALEAFRARFEDLSSEVFGGLCDSPRDHSRPAWHNCDTPDRRYRDLTWWVDNKGLLTLAAVEGKNLLSMRVVETKIELPQD